MFSSDYMDGSPAAPTAEDVGRVMPFTRVGCTRGHFRRTESKEEVCEPFSSCCSCRGVFAAWGADKTSCEIVAI